MKLSNTIQEVPVISKLGKDYKPLDDLKRFFEMLDYTEESENGNVFHPITISCCRAMMIDELAGILSRLKERANMSPEEWSSLLGD